MCACHIKMVWFYVGFFVIIIYLLGRLRHLPWVSGLSRKCVIITGCDSGFGNALAKSLYARGVYVFAGCFTEEGAKVLREQTGERLKTVKLDVTKTESIEEVYQFVKDNLPPNTVLWGLVNNAGISGHLGPLDFISREDMHRTMDVNCFGMLEMARVFLPLLKQSKGRIVNMVSMAGHLGLPMGYPYTASKYAMLGCSNISKHDMAVWGITVSTICPGFFGTNLTNITNVKRTFTDKWESLDPLTREEYGQDFHSALLSSMCDIIQTAQTELGAVTWAYEHALFARQPHNMYFPGKESKILIFFKDWLPKFVVDNMISRGLSGAVPKAARNNQK